MIPPEAGEHEGTDREHGPRGTDEGRGERGTGQGHDPRGNTEEASPTPEVPAGEALRSLARALVTVAVEVHADRLKVGPEVMPNGRSGHRPGDQQDQEQRNDQRGAA